MKSYRGNAIAVGVLFILCSAAAILSIVPLGATVGAPVDFAKRNLSSRMRRSSLVFSEQPPLRRVLNRAC